VCGAEQLEQHEQHEQQNSVFCSCAVPRLRLAYICFFALALCCIVWLLLLEHQLVLIAFQCWW
jgi:hypothetical protein